MQRKSTKLSHQPLIRAVPAATRTVQILRYLSESVEPAGVNRIAVELGLVPSTCLHILRVLTSEGLVAIDPSTKRYRLGVGILQLARAFLSRNDLSLAVQPVLDDLARRMGITSVFVERSGPTRLVVSAVSEGSRMFSIKVTVGSSFSAFSSASGRCVAAYSGLSRARLRARFSELRWQNPLSFEQWLSEVEEVRRKGYAVDEGYYVRGVTVIALPLINVAGEANYFLTWVALKDHISPERQKTLIEEATTAVEEIRHLLEAG